MKFLFAGIIAGLTASNLILMVRRVPATEIKLRHLLLAIGNTVLLCMAVAFILIVG